MRNGPSKYAHHTHTNSYVYTNITHIARRVFTSPLCMFIYEVFLFSIYTTIIQSDLAHQRPLAGGRVYKRCKRWHCLPRSYTHTHMLYDAHIRYSYTPCVPRYACVICEISHWCVRLLNFLDQLDCCWPRHRTYVCTYTYVHTNNVVSYEFELII